MGLSAIAFVYTSRNDKKVKIHNVTRDKGSFNASHGHGLSLPKDFTGSAILSSRRLFSPLAMRTTKSKQQPEEAVTEASPE